jgi:hypothetical protein
MEFRRDSRHDGEAAARNGAGGLLLGLLQKLGRTGAASHCAPDSELAPPGRRSGAGTDSLVPYLSQGRASRPAPLE